MKRIFIKDNILCKDENVFNYDLYMNACTEIVKDIQQKYDLKDPNLGILGIARGGLPLLVTSSQLLNFRNLSLIQCKMTNSDTPYDYGKFSIMSECIEPKKKKFILFEDIVYKGITSYGVINRLNDLNIDVNDVYSLVIDESFQNDSPLITFNGGYESKKDSWVHFFWVEDIRKLENQEVKKYVKK